MGAEQGKLKTKKDQAKKVETWRHHTAQPRELSKALQKDDSKTLNGEQTNSSDNVIPNQVRKKVQTGKESHQTVTTPTSGKPLRPDLFHEDLGVPKEKCYDPNDSSLVIVDAEDDMDFLMEDFKSPRAMMTCGHTVTPQSLTNWCRRQLDEGKDSFACGVCKATWTLEEVHKMALLTPEEEEYFENKLFSRWTEQNGARSCPGCNSKVLRTNLNNLCVQCTVCTVKRKEPFLFCWQCLEKWRGPAPRSDRCDNNGCSNLALETLKNCPEMIFNKVKGITSCPSTRGCPTCGLLIVHKGTGCKNITCPRCRKEFCFVCLKPTNVCCTHEDLFYSVCSDGVAPRQTQIPVLPPRADKQVCLLMQNIHAFVNK